MSCFFMFSFKAVVLFLLGIIDNKVFIWSKTDQPVFLLFTSYWIQKINYNLTAGALFLWIFKNIDRTLLVKKTYYFGN